MIHFHHKRRGAALVLSTGALLMALGTHRAYAAGLSSFRDIVLSIARIGLKIIPLLVAGAVLVFFYNLIFFIGNMQNVTERDKFKKYTVNALIGLFVILCVWGIVNVFTRTAFGTSPFIPQFKTSDNPVPQQP